VTKHRVDVAVITAGPQQEAGIRRRRDMSPVCLAKLPGRPAETRGGMSQWAIPGPGTIGGGAE
jgi:hypothetical protein